MEPSHKQTHSPGLTPAPPRTIYLLCPAGLQTGGPEAIHQLAGELLAQGHDANVVYLSQEICKVVHDSTGPLLSNRFSFPDVKGKMPEAYGIYGTREALVIEDKPENILIFPEALPFLHRLGSRMQKHLWWLSVNNALHLLEGMGGMEGVRNLPLTHLVQSAYAEDFLRRNGITQCHRLFDYTRTNFLEQPARPAGERKDQVLYNPRKGWEVVQLLIAAAPDLEWVPISGLQPDQVQELLLTSKVYIDFGEHPGKDRIPREAAISGCVVLTGRRGAADFFADLPIDDQYKFGQDTSLSAVVAKIRACIADFATHSAMFEPYRRFIRTERDEFRLQVHRIYG